MVPGREAMRQESGIAREQLIAPPAREDNLHLLTGSRGPRPPSTSLWPSGPRASKLEKVSSLQQSLV
jgi:hypothetical protein